MTQARKETDWQDFAKILGDVPTSLDPGIIKQKSLDYYWFSPILKRDLADKRADIVITPRDEEEVLRTVRTCVERRVPITVRAGGTGNYGQAIPTEGGAVLDLTELNRIEWIQPGIIRCEAGLKLDELDAAANETGWEIRLYPSTKRTATVGGHVAGGSGGVGSVRHGLLRDPGNVNAVRVVTLEDEPRVLELRGRDINQVNHAYGTNGIITALEMPLTPAHPWADAIASFDDFITASRFGEALGQADGVVVNEICVLAWPIPQYFKPLRKFIPEGGGTAFCIVAEQSLEWFEYLVNDFGGSICYKKNAEEVAKTTPLYEYTWNHTTLYAIKVDPSITYLQTLIDPGRSIEMIEHFYSYFGDETPMHVEFVRLHGQVGAFAVQLLRYTTEERLNEIIEYLEDHGSPVFNPHTPILEDGGMKMVDQEQLNFKREADPHGLSNPGKMRAWWEEKQAEVRKEGALYEVRESGKTFIT